MRATRARATPSLLVFRPVFHALRRDEVDAVAVASHHVSGNIVGDDPVGALGDSLGGCLLDHLLGLGGKADQKAGAPIA